MQKEAWEKEYKSPILISKKAEPQSQILTFLKYMRKIGKKAEGLNVLDLGSGTGRNSNYLAQRDNEVVGIEISQTAIKIAKERADKLGVDVEYLHQSIGEKYPFTEGLFDVIMDVTSSNALDEDERSKYLEESHRVLKKDGLFFVRALAKDKNAKNLIKNNPGSQVDTYILKEMGLSERVFSESDFRNIYGQYFEAKLLKKVFGYVMYQGQRYKRAYFIAYFSRKT